MSASAPSASSVMSKRVIADLVEAGNIGHAFLGYFVIFVLLCLASVCAAVLIVRGSAAITRKSK